MSNLWDFSAKAIDGDDRKFSDLDGQVCLVVNVASECGLTPQYDGLQRLYTQYRAHGFEILGFPCNQFGGQEPGSDAEIHAYGLKYYGIEFPMFGKVEVNGASRHPLFEWLTEQEVGPDGRGDVAWNFAKFLIGKDGQLVARFAPTVEPCSKDLTNILDEALAQS